MNQQQLSLAAQATLDSFKNLPQAERELVLALASQINDAASATTPAQRAEASSKLVEGVAAATTPQKTAPVSEIKNINGHNAVVGQITVNGQQLDTLLSEGSFNKTRTDQMAYAKKLGYRMATREEHRAYIEDLLAKEGNYTINYAEKNALKTYRERCVRDTESGLGVVGRRVHVYAYSWRDRRFPHVGALFVRASAELKTT